jgi:long-subunit acyl-CoA synthetase (AMP-forming)
MKWLLSMIHRGKDRLLIPPFRYSDIPRIARDIRLPDLPRIPISDDNGIHFLSKLYAIYQQKSVPYLLSPNTSPGMSAECERLCRDNPPVGDEGMVVFTSGTSGGVCKGVRLSHDNIASHIEMLREHVPPTMLGSDDRTAPVLPWTHCYGILGECFSVMDRLGTMKTSSSMMGWFYSIHTHHPTVLFVVPRILDVVLHRDRFLRRHLSRETRRRLWFGSALRYIVSGGATLPVRTEKEMMDELGVRVLQGYGCSEMSPMISLKTRYDDVGTDAGRLLPRVQIRFGDDDEIFVRGPNRFMGYLGEESLAPDAWHATGDIGYLTNDSTLSIIRRKSSRVKLSNGKFTDLDLLQRQIEMVIDRRVCVWEKEGSLHGVVVCPSHGTIRVLKERWGWVIWYARNEPLGIADGTLTLKGEACRPVLRNKYY